MRTAIRRKTTPKVVGGKPLRKNRTKKTPNYYNSPQDEPVIDRRKPGRGFRHILRQRDVRRFICLLPDWDILSKGLNAIVLAPGRWNCDGWHRPGVVAICAWQRELCYECETWWHEDHQRVLSQIGLPVEEASDGVFLDWDESKIRAYQLIHVLLHELGHHHDRMTTKSKRRASRGEGFAERYAIQHGEMIWESFLNEFGLP